jgi:hypothetical protein
MNKLKWIFDPRPPHERSIRIFEDKFSYAKWEMLKSIIFAVCEIRKNEKPMMIMQSEPAVSLRVCDFLNRCYQKECVR